MADRRAGRVPHVPSPGGGKEPRARNQDGRWRFTIVASNGAVLASSETYHNKSDCTAAATLIKRFGAYSMLRVETKAP
jgi:uncharacterized protein YegP (UPF0339 family)